MISVRVLSKKLPDIMIIKKFEATELDAMQRLSFLVDFAILNSLKFG